MILSATARRGLFGVSALTIALAAAPPVHADTTLANLAREIAELKASNKTMRSELSELRTQTHRTSTRVRAISASAATPVVPRSDQTIPSDAVPAFVTADKKLRFGAITITPGGFIAAESVFRSRTIQSDINSEYRAIPFSNNPLAGTNEERLTARQSRIALLAEGRITPTMLASGYMELDFLGAAQTANANEANAYQPRIRHLYATLDADDYGLHMLAGQTWSLATLRRRR